MDGRTDEQTETCMPQSPMLKQVQQKHHLFLIGLEINDPINTIKAMISQSVDLTTWQA